MSMNLPISFHIAVACSFLPKCSTSSLECAAIKKNQFHFWWTFRWFPVWGYYCFRFSWDHSHSFPGVHVTGISPAAFREESVCVPPPRPAPPHPRCQLCHMSSVYACLGPFVPGPCNLFAGLCHASTIFYNP